jgi:hypothetical protein
MKTISTATVKIGANSYTYVRIDGETADRHVPWAKGVRDGDRVKVATWPNEWTAYLVD